MLVHFLRREGGIAVTHNTSKEKDVINSAWDDDRYHADVHCGVISFRSKITRGCIPDREGHKKTRIYSASSSPLVSLLFVSIFFHSFPGVFPYLIYSFFSIPQFFYILLFFCIPLPLSLFPPIDVLRVFLRNLRSDASCWFGGCISAHDFYLTSTSKIELTCKSWSIRA